MLGAGSWGTALAIALAPRFQSIHLWTRDSERACEMEQLRDNRRYLPGFPLPQQVTVSADPAWVLDGAEVTLSVIPSSHLRAVLSTMKPHIAPGSKLVSATKGIEEITLARMSQVMGEACADAQVAVLSGPTFAREIAAGEPAAVVVAAFDLTFAEEIQRAFSTQALRLYASTDVVGVELGAALKNVIAIGAGICHGLGLGSNSVAALVTRGLAEISRLAFMLGGQPRTLSGLAGLGDLVLTATGDLSRNRFVGVQLGKGRKLSDVLSEMVMVAEGVATCRAAWQLGLGQNVEMPIIGKMYEVLYENKDPMAAIRELMERPLTTE